MNSILFLNDGAAEEPALALACFNDLSPSNIRGAAAAGQVFSPDNDIREAAEELGVTLPGKILKIKEIVFADIDLIIIFSDSCNTLCPALPGMPAVVRWKLSSPLKNSSQDCSWYDKIKKTKSLVLDLFEQGYMQAMVSVRRNAEQVMDSMQEGIIAHDLNRSIFFFNQAAERITGFSRHEIIGRDCHEIFSGGICSSDCSFKDPNISHNLPDSSYPLTIIDKAGNNKQLEMNVVEMKNFLNAPIGVIATFRDHTREIELATRLGEVDQFAGIIGNHNKMLGIYQTIRELAESNVPVFIEGESGTGKELVAAAIHSEGKRKRKLFVPVNCGALPENLLEAELFGHVKGAFTGAIREKKGRFELADGGTIFLDEIGDITPAMQVKLLRVLQDGTFQKVGGEKTLTVDVRLISATNKDIREEIKTGRFREDLFYRICVAPLKLPPLRERKSDIQLLARHFLKNNQDETIQRNIILAQDTLDALTNHNWPGNVRELQNSIRYLMFRCQDEVARPGHLPENIVSSPSAITINTNRQRRQKLNKEMVSQALIQTNNNRVQAARLLEVGRATLYRFLAKHNIT